MRGMLFWMCSVFTEYLLGVHDRICFEVGCVCEGFSRVWQVLGVREWLRWENEV